MKKSIIAAFVAIFYLNLSATAQERPIATTNNHTNNTWNTSTLVPTATRSRVAIAVEPADLTASATPVSGRAEGVEPAARPRTSAVRSSSAVTIAPVATETYRIGIGDILDIEIAEVRSNKSTLYTVLDGGVLDYPLVGSPLQVAGMTTDSIAEKLRSSIKVLDRPQIRVKVREYASHTVNVIGFVSSPGVKVLRREAVPLYVVLSEAMPLTEATRVTVVRGGRDIGTMNLQDANATNQLIVSNDLVKVSSEPVKATEFFFTGGGVNEPGQKIFHSGLTLTQAILASGGTRVEAGSIVRVSRQGNDGRLLTTEYDLRSIRAGKDLDPLLQKGDRIEVSRN